MTSENVTEPETVEVAGPQPSKAVDDRLIDELVSRAQAPCPCPDSPLSSPPVSPSAPRR